MAASHTLAVLPVHCIIDCLEKEFGKGVVSIEYEYAKDNPAHVAVTVPPELRLDEGVAEILLGCVRDVYAVEQFS